MDFLICNLSAGIMIILTLIMRKLAGFRIPNGVFCLLWAMIGVRLQFPVSLRTRLSILNIYFYRWNKPVPIKSLQNGTLHAGMMERLETAGIMVENHPRILLLVWMTGFAVMAAYFIRGYFRIWKEMRSAKPLEDVGWMESCIAEQKIRRRILLKSKEGMDTPMTWGIFRPVIYFPSDFDMENKSLARMILLHECGHIKHFHTIFKIWNMFLICAYWYNPIVWVMFFKFERDLEISADRYALRHTEGDAREVYAKRLIMSMEEMSHKSGLADRKKIVFLHMFYFFKKGKAKKDENERVEAIMKFKKMGPCAIVATLLIPLGMTTAFAITSVVLSEKETGRVLESTDAVNIKVVDVELETLAEAEPVSIFVDWKDLESYIVFENMERASYLYVQNYTYVTYGELPPKSISISTTFEGHKYKGTLDRTDYNYNDATDKYTGFYAGKIYRQD